MFGKISAFLKFAALDAVKEIANIFLEMNTIAKHRRVLVEDVRPAGDPHHSISGNSTPLSPSHTCRDRRDSLSESGAPRRGSGQA